MRIAVFSFTDRGTRLAEKLREGFAAAGHQAELQDRRAGLREAAGDAFRTCGALVFVGAAGIAVRGIAPFVKDKFTDPAVVSVDEFGRFAVPLLSGHVGGANELAELTARITGGVPVISTASDLNQIFAVDVWAEKQFLSITDRRLAKKVTAALLRGESVGFFSDFPVTGELPEGLVKLSSGAPDRLPERSLPEKSVQERPDLSLFPACVYVTCRSAESVRKEYGPAAQKILRLVPRCLSLGCGCKKDFPPEQAVRHAEEFLQNAGMDPEAVMEVATIDLKEKEAALRAVAKQFRGIYRLHSAEALAKVPGEFHDSDFVRQTVGVGNVCERAAMRYGTELLVPKTAYEGITFALSLRAPKLSF